MLEYDGCVFAGGSGVERKAKPPDLQVSLANRLYSGSSTLRS